MGIEAMARGAGLLHPEGSLTCINDVRLGPPSILKETEARPRRIEVSATVEHADVNESSV
jgi:hypothetical protein